MMSMLIQRARGLGHRAFYLHPEPQMGSGTTPDGHKNVQSQAIDPPAPETPPADTETQPEGETTGSGSK